MLSCERRKLPAGAGGRTLRAGAGVASALMPKGKHVEADQLIMGIPGKVARPVTESERARMLREYSIIAPRGKSPATDTLIRGSAVHGPSDSNRRLRHMAMGTPFAATETWLLALTRGLSRCCSRSRQP